MKGIFLIIFVRTVFFAILCVIFSCNQQNRNTIIIDQVQYEKAQSATWQFDNANPLHSLFFEVEHAIEGHDTTAFNALKQQFTELVKNIIKSDGLLSESDFEQYQLANREQANRVYPQPWNDHLSQQAFDDYILPSYGLESFYPPGVRKYLVDKYLPILKACGDTLSSTSALRIVHEALLARPTLASHKELDEIEGLGFYNILFDNLTIDCYNNVDFLLLFYHALGIPMYTDFGNRSHMVSANARHYILSSIHENGDFMPFEVEGFAKKDVVVKRLGGFEQVWRITNRINYDLPLFKVDNINDCPPTWGNPTLLDVTSLYGSTAKVVVTAKPPWNKPNELLYLCTFSPSGWRAIAYTKPSKGIATFYGIKTNYHYTAAWYRKGKYVTVGNIINLRDDGAQESVIADTTNRETAILLRKDYEQKRFGVSADSMIGSQIWGANSANFADKKLIFTIENRLPHYVNYFEVSNQTKFRYLWYKSAISTANVAFLQFVTNASTNTKTTYQSKVTNPNEIKLLKINVGTIPIQNIMEASELVKPAIDNDLLTISNYPNMKFDLGTPTEIIGVQISPRSDVNIIEPNDNYELYYWDNQWISLGMQTAKYNFLEYKNIPKNAVLWLRDHTKGQEEALFMLKNGIQVFI